MQVKKEVSFFKSLESKPEKDELSDILRGMKKGIYQRDIILEIRDRVGNGNEYGQLKKGLSGFTPSGTFGKSRRANDLIKYSKIVVLDIDNLSKHKLIEARKTAIKDKHTYAIFVSPSGKGLKILVRVDSDESLHKVAFNRVKDYYESLLGVKVDKSGKDVSRLCFVSYDRELYLNESAVEFEITKEVNEKFAKAVELTNKSYQFVNGQRNNFVYTLACYSNRLGIPEKQAERLIFQEYQYGDIEELKNSIKSGYSRDLTPITDSFKKGDPVEVYLNSKYDFRYNKVRGTVEYKKKTQKGFQKLTDRRVNSLVRELKLMEMRIPKNRLIELLESDFTPEFHPMMEYLNGLPKWDGKTDYLAELAARVKTDDNQFFLDVFKRWFVAMLACSIDPKIVNQWALILSGGQGIGKSTFIRKLLPPELAEYHYSGMIDPKSKDTLVHLAECFIIDMDELSNLTRKGANEVKEMITKDKIRVRKPYGKISEDLSRCASFAGSINETEFLTDITGNRRFLCFIVDEIDYLQPLNYAGIYSQAFALLKGGFKYYFDQAENTIISQRNERFRQKNLLEDLISGYVPALDSSNADLYFNAGEFLTHLNEEFRVNISETSNIKLGKLLAQKGFKKVKKGGREVYPIDINKNDRLNSGQLKMVS